MVWPVVGIIKLTFHQYFFFKFSFSLGSNIFTNFWRVLSVILEKYIWPYLRNTPLVGRGGGEPVMEGIWLDHFRCIAAASSIVPTEDPLPVWEPTEPPSTNPPRLSSNLQLPEGLKLPYQICSYLHRNAKMCPPQKTPRCSSCQNRKSKPSSGNSKLMEAIVPYFAPLLQLEIAEPACLWVSITFPEVRIRKESGPVGDSSLIL